ncbi:hypothetical protein OSTOST_23852, partial [Ostertagia ostertagi]
DLFVVDKLEPALGLDSFPASHPLYFELNNPSDVMEVFNPVTYDKGASLIAMIIALMGEKNFEKGVKRFLKNYSYGNADSEDFWDALENAGSKTKGPNGEALNISEFAAQWTTQVGFPLVTVEAKNSSAFEITQTRFKMSPNSSYFKEYQTPEYGFKWDIPIWYQVGDEPMKFAWLTR